MAAKSVNVPQDSSFSNILFVQMDRMSVQPQRKKVATDKPSSLAT